MEVSQELRVERELPFACIELFVTDWNGHREQEPHPGPVRLVLNCLGRFSKETDLGREARIFECKAGKVSAPIDRTTGISVLIEHQRYLEGQRPASEQTDLGE